MRKNDGKPFSLHKRGRYYYAQFKTPHGTFSTAQSTGESSRGRAEAWCIAELARGRGVTTRETLREFSRGFFAWDSPWSLDRRSSGKRTSRRNALEKSALLDRRILPALGELKLRDLDAPRIRAYRNELYLSGVSASTINKCLCILRTILLSADELGLIRSVPRIDQASGKPRERGMLTIDEARRIFRVQWIDYRAYMASLIAATTGLRASEIQALTLDDVLDDGILVVRRAWDEKLRVLNETTKSGRARHVLVPGHVRRELDRLIGIHPSPAPGAFLFFSSKKPGKPCERIIFLRGLYRAMGDIGITAGARLERNISFHSWRYFANSLLINAGLPLVKVQSLIGHSSIDMSRHYYHVDDLQDVLTAQETLLSPEESN